ncbi:hypothetical protein PMIT1342_01663 [Prochlorococcus marinus str. MIT 1342]|uniref:hypothetical protein n=1 Tax=Prochlorococcus TaxID=1218 RepID=UPI0007B37E74|nr:hypothetical protein [Prochlorococcus marinus]KZR81327.1 hypothetical protein PMIT1342_01663 [Prochlorococcus marinus str. MIT 1342]
MFSPFCISSNVDSADRRRHYQNRKLEMLLFLRDGLERRLSAVKAAIETLEQQIQRDQNPAS